MVSIRCSLLSLLGFRTLPLCGPWGPSWRADLGVDIIQHPEKASPEVDLAAMSGQMQPCTAMVLWQFFHKVAGDPTLCVDP